MQKNCFIEQTREILKSKGMQMNDWVLPRGLILICLYWLQSNVRITSAYLICNGGSVKSRRISLHAASSEISTEGIKMASADDIIAYADRNGVNLSLSTLGPGYRSVARAKHDEDLIIGYCEGFIRPGNSILHLDSMKVFKKSLTKCREENAEGFKGGGTLGVGLMLGCLCLTFGLENGCSTAEFLAIDDEDRQHKRLVRYYKLLGLKVVRYVGEDIKSIPDRLIWGGVGTLMSESIDTLMNKWSATFLDDS